MKKLVIIGGGFAGSTIARSLERDFDVTLIDSKDYFEFTPSILRSIVEPTHLRKVQVLHTHYLHRARVNVGIVTSLDRQFVYLGKEKIPYDYCAICSGSTYATPFKEANIITATRATHLRQYYDSLCSSDSVLIIGGGLVGVELASEIIEHYPSKKVTLVHGTDKLIERNSPKAIRYATEFLSKRGVEIIYRDRVTSFKKQFCITQSGKKLKADLIFSCVGILPNYDFMNKSFKGVLNERGFIKVTEFLQVLDNPNIFVAGDVSDRIEEKTAQNAERQATLVASNIRALERGKPLEKYTSKPTPVVISLGKYRGILSTPSFTLTGVIPGMIKKVIEFKEMAKFR